MTAAAPVAGEVWTERRLLDMLRSRYTPRVNPGNGPRWAYLEHIRDQAGAWANRTIDALVLDLWPSSRHILSAFEVKTSLTDYRRELADQQAKSAPWTDGLVDYFWIVAPAGVVPVAELPASWGLMQARGGRLVIAKRAEPLRPQNPGYLPQPALERGVVASMLRAAAKPARRSA